MKDRSVRLLLVCVVLVGLFIVAQEYWRKQNTTRKKERQMTFNIDLASMSLLSFKGTNVVVNCVKENSTWMVGNPDLGMGRADVALIHQLVSAFNLTTNGTTITAKELKLRGLDASEYGFTHPLLEIAAVDNQGRHEWQIGRDTPLGNELYIRQAGEDDIHTIPARILTIIPIHPDLLRNRVLFPTETAGIKRIEVRGPGGFVRVVKEGSNQWRIQQPIVAQADPLEVAAYIETLQKIRIEAFFNQNVSDLSAYGLQSETRQISMGGSDGLSGTLVLGDPVPGRPGLIYARRTDDTSVFALKEEVLKLINLEAKDLRDARVLTLPKETINSVYLRHADEQVAMGADTNGVWVITRPARWNADSAAIYNLIDLWSHAVIMDYDVATNSVATDWIVEFSSASGASNRIEVLPANGHRDGLLIRMNGEPAIYRINLPEIPGSIINPLVYKDRHVWNLNRKDISQIALQKNGQPRQVVERSADGRFVSVEASGVAQIDAQALEQLLNRLSNIITPGYIAYNPRNLAIYGLAEPAVELYVGLADPNELGRSLLIGRESTEGYYSMVKGRDLIFYLDKQTAETIASDLLVRPEPIRGDD